MKMENKELGRCVYVPALARMLLRNGHKIIDIKPNRQDKERTVFVFADDETFNADLEKAIEEEALEVSAGCCKIVPAELGEQIGDYAALSAALTEEVS